MRRIFHLLLLLVWVLPQLRADTADEAWQRFQDGSRDVATLADVLPQLPDAEKGARIRSELQKSPPRAELVELLNHPILAVRLGALEILEEMAGGDFSYNPWAPADSPENTAALVRWKQWADEPVSEQDKITLFSDEQRFAYMRDLLAEDRDKAARARRMLQAEGLSAVGFLETYLQNTPALSMGHRARIREAQYQIVLSGQLGEQASTIAHQLAFGSRDQLLSALDATKSSGMLAMPILRDFIVHSDPLVRETAIDSFLAVGGKQAVEIVAPILKQEPDVNVIHGAMRRLKDIPGEKTAELVASFLNSEDEDLLISAIRTSLSLRENSEQNKSKSPADDIILKTLTDKRWRVRAESLEYVSASRLEAAKNTCLTLLDDPDDFVRFSAIKTSGALNLTEALPKLRQMFYQDESTTAAVVAGFGALKQPLDEDFLKHLDAASTEARIAAISQIASNETLAPLALRYAADRQLDVACAALRALVSDSDELNKPEICSAILTALRSGESAKVEVILNQLELPPSTIRDPRVTQALEKALGDEAGSTALDPLYTAFMKPGLDENRSGQPIIPHVQEELAKEILKYTRDGKTPGDQFRAALSLAHANYPDGYTALLELLPSLTTAQKTEICHQIYKPSVQEAVPVLTALMRDPVSEVRSGAASAALSNDSAQMFLDLVLRELTQPEAVLTPSEVYSYRFESVARSRALASSIQRWAITELKSADSSIQVKVLSAIALRQNASTESANALSSQTASSSPLVRRAAWFSLLKVKPQSASECADQILNDPEAFVREALPCALNPSQSNWHHHFSDVDWMEDTNWYSSGRPPRIDAKLRQKLETQRDQDTSPRNRFEASYTLLLLTGNTDLDALVQQVREAPEELDAPKRIAYWLRENAARATPSLAPLLAVADTTYIDAETLEKLNAKIMTEKSEGFSTFASLATIDAHSGSPTDSLLADESASPATERKSLAVLFFFKPGCPECLHAKQLLDSMKNDFPLLELHEQNILTPDGTILNQALCQRFRVPSALHSISPAIFTQDGFLIRDQITAPDLGRLLSKTSQSPQDDSWFAIGKSAETQAKQAVDRRYASYTLPLVIGAGLLDGVNPCAFATIIFLLSYLQIARRTPREMLMVGIAFISAVFIAYLLAGLVLYQSLALINERFAGIQRWMNLIFGLLALFAAYLSFRDAWKSRAGRLDEMSLQLPGFLKSRIRSVIRTSARARNFIIAAFVCGLVVSLLELACTGQVYAPIIYQIQQGRLDAVLWLIVYNLAFIVPLIVIFLLAYGGMRSETLIAFQKKHTGWVKLGLGLLFVLLAVFILFGQKLLHLQ
ncbi:HEAT repeat domain-containing protein [Luteolibacter pohnpeiensis]|uniref:HEAT repeat domain-containing protein n=1 Tax=Luteolibacter pohnpeiensis TaxID=454153 RepID=A0A934S396_9BACT|nr:HEAT repeat domain-containing protein [Luteolibacter pohnpeiensis]MBK1881666.1 HEAT repeat domain-containing protein [Luteolibacter pohnpeiensis]